MDKDNCVMCNKEIDLMKNDTYEYDLMEGVWCRGCYEEESNKIEA